MTREIIYFLVIGLVQYLVDTTLFAALYLLVGYPILINVITRGVAATLGYYLNGRFTFRVGKAVGDAQRKIRFILTWICLTALSTIAIAAANQLSDRLDWPVSGLAYSKYIIEAALVTVSFFVQKLWVYTKEH